MSRNRDSENEIYENKSPAKGRLHDISVKFSRGQAEELAESWERAGAKLFGEPIQTRVHHRFVKVDGISYPLFIVIARGPKPESAAPNAPTNVVPCGLEAYSNDLMDNRVLYGDPGNGYQHTWPCPCGCRPITQALATERNLRSRGLWPE